MMAGPLRWMACECLNPRVQTRLDMPFDEDDLSWHVPGCATRQRAAALAMLHRLYDVDSLHPAPRVLRHGLDERHVDDLYQMAVWFSEVMQEYHTKEQHYGRAWSELGWLAQVAQIYRRARRLVIMGWLKYDEDQFDADSAEQNAGDLVAHSYFFIRLLRDGNRKGRM